MKTKIVQILLIVLCTVLAAACQDMLPSFGGAKVPVLLALSLHWAFTERRVDERDRHAEQAPFFIARWVPAVLLAGACEDALSEFPSGCAVGFFLLAGTAARFVRQTIRSLEGPVLGLVATAAAAPLHEVWLSVWGVVGDDSAFFVRFFASALPAVPAGAIIFTLMPRIERRTGFEGPSSAGRFA